MVFSKGLDLIQQLLGMQSSLQENSFKKRVRIATFIDRIADCIDEIIT